MGYNNQKGSEKQNTYDRTKDVVFFKGSSNPTGKRYLNVEVYSYNGGPTKIRIRPAGCNTNPNADQNKKWVPQPGISGLTKEEILGLIKSLQDASKCEEL